MKDFLGNELEVDQEVVAIQPQGSKSTGLIKGTITAFTKCYVRIQFPKSTWSGWAGTPVLVSPEKIIII